MKEEYICLAPISSTFSLQLQAIFWMHAPLQALHSLLYGICEWHYSIFSVGRIMPPILNVEAPAGPSPLLPAWLEHGLQPQRAQRSKGLDQGAVKVFGCR